MFTIGEPNSLGIWLSLGIGLALALLLGSARARREGVRAGRILLASVLAPLFAAFFSHLCYCLTNAAYLIESHSAGYLLRFWDGGYMFYGGILGAGLGLLLAGCGKSGCVRRLLEAYAPAAALMVVAARIAEGFFGQGYGDYWFDEPNAFCRLPFMVYDPYYESWAWAIFLAEALVALLLMAYLWMKKPAFAGDGALLLMGLYAAAQVVLESLRRDEFLRWGFVRIEEVFSGVALLLVLIVYCVRAGKGRSLQKALCFLVFLLMAALCLLLEFATEGRIPFLLFLEVYQCYLCMAAACVVMAACVFWMRHLCHQNLYGEQTHE